MTGTASWSSGNGQGLTWGTANFTAANFNSLATGACQASAALDNSTALDLYADVSFSLVVGGTTTAASFLALHLLPLNQDGTTYGDGAVAGGSVLPSAAYQVGAVNVLSGVTSGSPVIGTVRGVLLPPGKFVLVLVNQLGVPLNVAAAAAVQYRTYNENLNR